MNIDLEQSIRVPLSRRKELPECSGIYVVRSGERILYVGQSQNILARWHSHHQQSAIQAIDPNAEICCLPMSSSLDFAEQQLIQKLQPELNIQWAHKTKTSSEQPKQVREAKSPIQTEPIPTPITSQNVQQLFDREAAVAAFRWLVKRLAQQKRKSSE